MRFRHDSNLQEYTNSSIQSVSEFVADGRVGMRGEPEQEDEVHSQMPSSVLQTRPSPQSGTHSRHCLKLG